MSSILTPGYVKWDGTKYILDPTLQGPQGPTGPTGPAGPSVITLQNAGVTLTGSPFTTVNLTGRLSAVNSGSGVATVSLSVDDTVTLVIGTPYTVGTTETDLAVTTSSLPITITLPATPDLGRKLIIMDASGLAGTNNITVQGNGRNINGSSSLVINTNFAVKTIIFSGTFWNIVS